MATTDDRRETDSGIEIKPVYSVARRMSSSRRVSFARIGPYKDILGSPGGRFASSAGFGSAEETNQRFRYLSERGQTGSSPSAKGRPRSP